MLNAAWQWPQPSCDVECHLTQETERVMFLVLWGIKCKWINGTDFLHTSGNTGFFQVSKHYESLVISASEEICAFQKVRTKLLLFFPFLILLFSLEYVEFFCCCLVKGLREGNGGSLQTTWLNMTGVNQSSSVKPVLVKKSTAALSGRINIFVLFSCILAEGEKAFKEML